MPKTTKKTVKKTTKKLGAVKKGQYHLEVSVNDEIYRGNAENLAQALNDFIVSPAFPFAIKTRTILKYGNEKTEKQRIMHVPAARRLFRLISTKPTSLELLAGKLTNELV